MSWSERIVHFVQAIQVNLAGMMCSKDAFLRFADAFLLMTVFLFQNVILNFFIIRHFRMSSLPFLWFLADFICLLIFSFTLFIAYRSHHKARRREKHNSSLTASNSFNSTIRTNSRQGNRSNSSDSTWPPTFNCFSQISKLPFSYVTWLIYSVLIISKIIVLFKSEIPQHLKTDEFFGPQIVKISIGVTAIVFSLLVEAHHDSQHDSVRNAYVKSVSYGMALEILDSVSFLTLLISSESHFVYTFKFENFILILSSLNLMLPAVTLYKLTLSNFGKTYPVPLETLYKFLHLILINVPYFGVRLYLWRWFSTDTSIFIVKNIYAIMSFCRDIYPDLKRLRACYQQKPRRTISFPKQNCNGSIPSSLNSNGKLSNCNGTVHGPQHSAIEEEDAIGLAIFNGDHPDEETGQA